MESITKLPVRFGISLLQNPRAMQRFYQLSPGQRQAVLSRAKGIASADDMKAFVAGLNDPEF